MMFQKFRIQNMVFSILSQKVDDDFIGYDVSKDDVKLFTAVFSVWESMGIVFSSTELIVFSHCTFYSWSKLCGLLKVDTDYGITDVFIVANMIVCCTELSILNYDFKGNLIKKVVFDEIALKYHITNKKVTVKFLDGTSFEWALPEENDLNEV